MRLGEHRLAEHADPVIDLIIAAREHVVTLERQGQVILREVGRRAAVGSTVEADGIVIEPVEVHQAALLEAVEEAPRVRLVGISVRALIVGGDRPKQQSNVGWAGADEDRSGAGEGVGKRRSGGEIATESNRHAGVFIKHYARLFDEELVAADLRIGPQVAVPLAVDLVARVALVH